MRDVQPGSTPRLLHYLSRYFSTEAINSIATVAGVAAFTRLVDPVPEPGGLGEHVTLDLAGLARFGPDLEWV